MVNVALRLEHSVALDVPVSFAWRWRTDITNWDDPPARFQLDGPFDTGSWGTTMFPGQPPIRWQLRDVHAPHSFVIEMPLDRAVLSFSWTFEATSERRTLMTQRIVLSGESAATYVDQVRTGFGSTLEPGMRRIATAIEVAARSGRSTTE
jgi:Polyketide cyclase / dehydrase and lipid transport